MTGRAGYFRRVQATEKSVEQKVELYNNDVELHENAAENHFKMAIKEALPQHEGIDVSSLLFFQPSALTSAASSSNPVTNTLAIGNVGTAVAGEGDAENQESSDEEGGMAGAYNSNPLSAMRFALPKAKQTSLTVAPKSQPKAASKATQQAKSKANARGKKREVEQDLSLSIVTLESSAKLARSSGDTMDSNDTNIANEFNTKVQNLKANMFAMVVDGDSGVQEGLKAANKSATEFIKAVKHRLKMVGRRKDLESAQPLLEVLQSHSELIDPINTMCTKLTASLGEDTDHLDMLLKLQSEGWNVPKPLFKRAIKCAVLSFLKFSKWSLITTTVNKQSLEVLGEEHGREFINMMINDCIQRLLKAVAANKVPWHIIISLLHVYFLSKNV